MAIDRSGYASLAKEISEWIISKTNNKEEAFEMMNIMKEYYFRVHIDGDKIRKVFDRVNYNLIGMTSYMFD